ncbi:MAG: nicotinate-nicotinamide nucleotide adenylyltransferase [Holosporales bacterium]
MNPSDALAKIAVFWGTFDPPTRAHGALLSAAIHDHGVERGIVVIHALPHKGASAPLEHRLHMLNLMLGDLNLENQVEVRVQTQKHPLGYDTLKSELGMPLAVLAGSDSFGAWVKTPEDLAPYDGVWIAARAGSECSIVHPKVRLLTLPKELAGLSSSCAREALGRNQDVSAMLTPRVLEYIMASGLYRAPFDEQPVKGYSQENTYG